MCGRQSWIISGAVSWIWAVINHHLHESILRLGNDVLRIIKRCVLLEDNSCFWFWQFTLVRRQLSYANNVTVRT